MTMTIALGKLRMDAEGVAALFEVVPIAERGRTPWAEVNWKVRLVTQIS